MYLRDLVMSLRRRWVLLLCAIAITAGAALLTARAVPAEYETTASVLLVPPRSTEDPGANRYLSLGGLNQATTVLIRSLNSDETHAKVQRTTPVDGEYVVESDWTTSAPLLIVRGTADDPESAESLVSGVLDQVPASLFELQDRINVQPSALIESLELSRDAEPSVMRKPQIRAVLAVSCVLFGVLVLGISSLDGLLRSRRQRTAEKSAPARTGDVDDGADAPFAGTGEHSMTRMGPVEKSELDKAPDAPELTSSPRQ